MQSCPMHSSHCAERQGEGELRGNRCFIPGMNHLGAMAKLRREEFAVIAAILFALALPARAVQITEGSLENRPQFIVQTESATWFYDRAGGGFSRLIDRSGRDWIAFSKAPLSEFPASAAAGYRGLGNLVFGANNPDAGAGHPGFDQCVSEIVEPNRIRTRSRSGWQWSWVFTESTATFVMEKADPEHTWWFLYEGPVAGRFAPSQQYWGTDRGGPNRDIPVLRNQRFGHWRWVYFGDVSAPRVFFAAQHEPDEFEDTFWYLGSSNGGAATAPDGMVVFGFGRGPGTRPLFRGAGQRITVGLLDMQVASDADHAALAARIEDALAGRAKEPAVDRSFDVWHGPVQQFGHLGEPQRWVNVLGNISPASEVAAATCTLNRQPPRPLTLGTDLHRLAARGDFNVELNWDDLRPVTNHLTITAEYRDGLTRSTNVTLLVHRHRVWPLPYRVNFASTTNLQDVVQVVDGRWHLTDDGVRTAHPWYDRVLSLGDSTWTNYDARIRLTVHGFTPSQRGPPTYNVTHIGVAVRWRGHTADGKQPSERWYPLGAQGELLLTNDPSQSRWRILLDGGPHHTSVNAPAPAPVPLNRPLEIRAQVSTLGDGQSRYRFKHWPSDEPEPEGWMVEAHEQAGVDYPSGSLCLVPHNSDVTIHEVTVIPL
jgi:hypothetical protein